MAEQTITEDDIIAALRAAADEYSPRETRTVHKSMLHAARRTLRSRDAYNRRVESEVGDCINLAVYHEDYDASDLRNATAGELFVVPDC